MSIGLDNKIDEEDGSDEEAKEKSKKGTVVFNLIISRSYFQVTSN